MIERLLLTQLTGSVAAVGIVILILCFDVPGVVTVAVLGRLLVGYYSRGAKKYYLEYS
ncbi:MAG: hypothetical protein WBX02_15375 [Terriglobales bacterium]